MGHLDNLKFPKIDFTDLISETEVQALLEKAKCSERVRDDYNELIALTQLLITKNTSNFMFMKPGTLHKARWMAKLLYTIKMVLVQENIDNELPPGSVFEATEKSKRK